MTKECVLVNDIPKDLKELPEILFFLGVIPIGISPLVPFNECYEVNIDGGLFGYVPKTEALELTNKLRALKTQDKVRINDFCNKIMIKNIVHT